MIGFRNEPRPLSRIGTIAVGFVVLAMIFTPVPVAAHGCQELSGHGDHELGVETGSSEPDGECANRTGHAGDSDHTKHGHNGTDSHHTVGADDTDDGDSNDGDSSGGDDAGFDGQFAVLGLLSGASALFALGAFGAAIMAYRGTD